MINSYCGYEAGVRNLRKCIDRVFRKIVYRLDLSEDASATSKVEGAAEVDHLLNAELLNGPQQYQVNTKNLERFLDIPSTDDTYHKGINQ
jgi:ATP-dependent Lon protease